MELTTVRLNIPEGCNIILGQSHFVKTVEDLYETMVTSLPSPKFGVAFCEASGPRKVRRDGTDPDMIKAAEENANALGAGHSFIIVMKDGFPINVLNAVKMCPEFAGSIARRPIPSRSSLPRRSKAVGSWA